MPKFSIIFENLCVFVFFLFFSKKKKILLTYSTQTRPFRWNWWFRWNWQKCLECFGQSAENVRHLLQFPGTHVSTENGRWSHVRAVGCVVWNGKRRNLWNLNSVSKKKIRKKHETASRINKRTLLVFRKNWISAKNLKKCWNSNLKNFIRIRNWKKLCFWKTKKFLEKIFSNKEKILKKFFLMKIHKISDQKN